MGRFYKSLYICAFAVLMLYLIGAVFALFCEATPSSEAVAAIRVCAPSGGGSRVYDVIKEEEAYEKRVYLGGGQVGFELNIDGVMVAEFNEVDTVCGAALLKSELEIGDIITDIDGSAVKTADDVTRLLNNGGGSEFNFGICRSGRNMRIDVCPLIDRVSGEYRLGISVQERIAGIGTVTCVRRDGSFAALGHAVGVDGEATAITGGRVYECKITGIERGVRGKAGALRGNINKKKPLGSVCKNCNYGLYGKFDSFKGYAYDVGTREEIVCDRAQIYSEISGLPAFYDVEIVKTAYQSEVGEKGLVLKVTDKRLIALTGGIVQGMSGSPIIQNNKIVGAVTHVFVNDPLRGYGIYIDWMLENQ